jgi:SAM-dependent methyltransferase
VARDDDGARSGEGAAGYRAQHRGAASAYDRYLRAMDASLRQKVALTAAHLLCEGEVADMGMGSGATSFALASLYPALRVIGVDVDPEMVARARAAHRLPNLRFVEGDIAAPCFPARSLEAVVDCSVLHHVTSFNGYDRGAAARALAVQVEALSDGGVLVLRDFVDPGPGTVWLDLRSDDGDDSSDPRRCSTAALFERFAGEFRALRAAGRGFAHRRVAADATGACPQGFRRYEVAFTHAVELVLRKDYRESWEEEAKEEYTFATQAELEALFESLGLRVLASQPMVNPWIVRHRLRDRVRLWTTRGEPLDHPPTSYFLVGQRVAPGEGVRIEEAGAAVPRGYLEMSHWRRRRDGRVLDLVRRPGAVVDVVPYYESAGTLHVLGRRSYPRPILACGPGSLEGARASSYLTEPLNALEGDGALGRTVEELLARFPGIGAEGIRRVEVGAEHYPSPGGLQELVRSVLVEIAPVAVEAPLENTSGFSTSGVLRAIEARQLLRAAAVGALPEARLELATYELCLRRGLDPGDWIGESLTLGPARVGRAASLDRPAERTHRRAFERASGAESPRFLELRAAVFVERDANGAEVARQERELVEPRAPLGTVTVAVALLARAEGEVLIGLDDDDRPAAQCFTGHSELWVAPAWRLPRAVRGVAAARGWIRERIAERHGVCTGEIFELGGRYHPSPGVTTEVVYPIAVEALEERAAPAPLVWVPLRDLVAARATIRDGHLRIVALRAAHALGLLCAPCP